MTGMAVGLVVAPLLELRDLGDLLTGKALLGEDLAEHVAKFAAHEVAGGDVIHGQAQSSDLPGEELGVLQVALGTLAVLLGGDAVAGRPAGSGPA